MWQAKQELTLTFRRKRLSRISGTRRSSGDSKVSFASKRRAKYWHGYHLTGRWHISCYSVSPPGEDGPLKKSFSFGSVEEQTNLNCTSLFSHKFSKCSSRMWRCNGGVSRITQGGCFRLLTARWRVPLGVGEGESLQPLKGSEYDSLLEERSLFLRPFKATACFFTAGVYLTRENQSTTESLKIKGH